MSHAEYLDLAFSEAIKGYGSTYPNPMVGALIVREGQILSKGYHHEFGKAHAEVDAINNAKKKNINIEGATLYCTLEPCSHLNKKTPPCTHALVENKIAKVVIGTVDENPQVSGRGIEYLKANNIEVELLEQGELKDRLDLFYASFFHNIKTKKQYTHLKWAQSLDGKIALKTGESKWITNSASREMSHLIRLSSDAIITTAGTIRQDNPSLTIRLKDQPTLCPYRIILTRYGNISPDAQVFNDEFNYKTIVMTQSMTSEMEMIKARGSDVLLVDSPLQAALLWCKSMNFLGVMMEGGVELISTILSKRLFDHAHVFSAPKILGEGIGATDKFQAQSLTNALDFTTDFKDIKWKDLQGDLYFNAKKS